MFATAIEKFIQSHNYPTFCPKAILFDMDGVLMDSMKFHAKAWVESMKKSGFEFSITEAYMNEGSTGHATINRVFIREKGREATEEEKKRIYKLKSEFFDACGKAERMPYALELLQKIKAHNTEVLVVTGSGQPSLLDGLNSHFPNIFQKEKMITAFDVKHGKPHPEPYLMALEKANVHPWEAVVVENAPMGVESSKAAGIFTIAVNTGPLDPSVLSDKGADIVLSGIEELYEKWDTFLQAWHNTAHS
jgi:HAD superfamily hydrolase (TIGR01509 family)